ncbi:hypothetical protein [Halococcoides cellulosivorans]|uniref:Uncharacterized protein n=1 Tax=Halococcoides cellulosivorans TaxID=1679096 RepID=A0A2R4WZC7_9EURY|nr:hypothetical protein [Halococcoides cellulosivorans]AWB26865.1 hypothetical protein HARCEL1_03610 [Halococcoides cellulosivorans]
MAIDWIARRLLDWIDMDDEEAAEVLPGSLAEGLPERSIADPTGSRPSETAEADVSTEALASGDTDAEPAVSTLAAETDDGPSRLRRFGPYLLGLGAALAAFVGVLGVVHVVRGWIEELRVGHTPMDGAVDDESGPAPVSGSDGPDAGRVPAAERSMGDDAVPSVADEESDGDVLAALVGLGFHKLVDGVVSRPPVADEGTTIPVERPED